ncbi:DUF3489 domain-containing protein [Sphingopyxis sp. SCN 67-31]|uniref:DUF3489 domain-containing protein n=1 Tax=Sphingopyxis sp. SCN 67-31 TaxID=1660142 RepID=UPI00086EE302|nr:DUF3489 domain-containing protein [Sphingopyxis sp. SCN 67-31]ODU28364.1 MAG: hypothetical protein ABS88_13230 [Sphingopyxis sp. SCN 67-31]
MSNNPTKTSKSSQVVKLLSRAKGATMPELTSAMNWQPHSCRAFMTGLRKKGYVIVREARTEGAAAYCITNTAVPTPSATTVPEAPASESAS